MVSADNYIFKLTHFWWTMHSIRRHYRLLAPFFKFWRLTDNLQQYIADVKTLKALKSPDHSQVDLKSSLVDIYLKLKLIALLLTVGLLHNVYLGAGGSNYHQTSDLAKLLHFDISLFLHCPAAINYLWVAGCSEVLYFLYITYGLQDRNDGQGGSSLRWLWWPLLFANEMLNSTGSSSSKQHSLNSLNKNSEFFLESTVLIRRRRRMSTRALVGLYVHYWMLIVCYMVSFFGFFLTLFLLQAMVYAWRLRAELTIFPACPSAFIFEPGKLVWLPLRLGLFSASLLHYVSIMGGICYTNLVPSVLFVAFSAAIFIQLKQLNRLMTHPSSRKLPAMYSLATLSQYLHHHSGTFHLIAAGNSIFGRLLVAFFTLFMPFNTYLVIGIISGQFSALTTLILANIVMMQFLAMIGLHLICVQYSYRLHASNWVLLHWCSLPLDCRRKEVARMATQGRLKLANYAVGFHREPSKRFGITYGSLSLMTWATFGNCIFYYLQFILYWYKLFN